MTDMEKLIDEIIDALATEMRRNKGLRSKLRQIVKRHASTNAEASRESKSRRRKPGVVDPMAVYRESPNVLREKLEQLNLDELKDIVAEQGMDRSKLAMKWKSTDRLIELILESVASRSQKGDAFRKSPNSSDSP